MKILFITHRFYPDVGGIEVNSEVLAGAFQKAGHEVRLITWTKDSGEKSFPYPVIRHPEISVLFREHRWADVIYENNPSLRLAWPAALLGKPSVVALRTWIRRTDGGVSWQDKLKLLWLKRSRAVIAISEAVRKAHWPQAAVIGNPYRYDLFRVLPNIPRTLDFVFFGRLVSDKGVALAIEAFKQVLDASTSGKTFSLTIVGDGPERPHLEELVNKLNISNFVTFTGMLRGEALVSCLNQHNYVLVPSLWEEPFGNVALEGMACGCIPLVSDGGGLPDAVGSAGLVFTRGDASSLKASIQQLISDPSLEQRLRDAAEEHLRAHHPSVVAGKYLNVIETALKNQSGL